MTSPTMLAWVEAGSPEHGKKIDEKATGPCATCGYEMPPFVPLKEIDNPTFSNHADFINGPSASFCQGCAWLYGAGKGKPGNFIAVDGHGYQQLVISTSSPVPDKEPWISIIDSLLSLPADTKVFGVLTTDVKPRVWPRGRVATIGRFGLYVHALEYDLSAFITMNLSRTHAIINKCVEALDDGFSKAALYSGLLKDQKKVESDPLKYIALERIFSEFRKAPEFIPALIISQKGWRVPR